MVMYGYVGLCMAVYGCVWLCIAMYGCVALCTAIERNVFHILANGEPLYDAYTTYLPTQHKQFPVKIKSFSLPLPEIMGKRTPDRRLHP